jgi:hypothetical protein
VSWEKSCTGTQMRGVSDTIMDASGRDMESLLFPALLPRRDHQLALHHHISTTSQKVRFDHYDLSPWHMHTIFTITRGQVR